MVAVQEMFRSGLFGLIKELAALTSSPLLGSVAEVVTRAHILGFGILVVVVILLLPNGIVGDWQKIQRHFSGTRGTRHGLF
jgi:ABC-type branched-subunit amino acid transport system permease subunit